MYSNQKKFFMIASIGLVMAIAVPSNAVLATSSAFLNVKTAVVNGATNGAALDAVLYTGGHIPKDGSGGAFGYGILTSAGDNAVIVATTHKGVKDSVAQGSDAGPIWHTHFVRLGVDPTSPCNSGTSSNVPEVQAITFQEPGRVIVTGNTAIFNLIPSSFTGTDSFTGKLLRLTPGHNVQNVVSFVLQPIMKDTVLHVCVTNISPAQQIVTNPNTIGG
jgi:hypothetical protein